MDFTDQVVIVTGAAGNLGRAVVRQFLQQGATVCGLDHRQARMTELAEAAPTNNKFIAFDGVDVTDRDAVLALAPKVHAQAGQATILVNALGGFSYGEPVYALSAATWDRMLRLNVVSFLNLVEAFTPDLLAQGRGKVVAVGARASLAGGAKMGAYAAAKSALLRLVESMAAELGPQRVQVNCVLPGTLDTPQNRAEMPGADFTKWVSVAAAAEAILFLASPAADRINGAAIPVYG